MKVFVAGATGETGRRIVQVLTQRQIPIRALVRNLDKGRRLLPDTAELSQGDVLKPDTLRKSIADCDVIICATGAQPSFDITGPYKVDYEGTANLVDIAREKNIKQFVLVSSLCVSRFFHPLNLFWLVLYWKRRAEEYLIRSNVPYTIVRPGGLKNDDNSNAILMAGADTLFEGSIPRIKVAEVCVEALSQDSACNKIVEIVAPYDADSQSLDRLFEQVS